MNISNLKWILLIVIVIAVASLFYTAATNDDSPQEPLEQSEADDTASNETEKLETEEDIKFFNYFEHTKPGEYSEIFVEITGFKPKVQKIIYIRNVDTGEYIAAGGQDLVTTELGHISTRFVVTSYGNYEVVTNDSEGNEVTSPIIAVN